MNIKYFFFNPFMERAMVISDENGTGVILDPGCKSQSEKDRLFSYIEDNGIKPAAIILTHAHFDHTYGVSDCIKRYNIPVYMHPADKVIKDNMAILAADFNVDSPDTSWNTVDIEDGQTLSFGSMDFEVIWTPGHSPGSVCYYCPKEKELFSGDTLFAGTIGRTDHRWGEYDDEIRSIMDKIMGLDGDVKVHPCHGGGTTIAYERTNNPFLQPFNEIDPQTGAVDGIEFQ